MFLSLMVVLISANSTDPNEMQHNAAFIWVFTVCQSSHLGVSSIQRVKQLEQVPVVLAILSSTDHICKQFRVSRPSSGMTENVRPA